MFWLCFVYAVSLAFIASKYYLATLRDRRVLEHFGRMNRLQTPIRLLVIEIGLVATMPREGDKLEMLELVQITNSIDRLKRRLEYTRQSTDL